MEIPKKRNTKLFPTAKQERPSINFAKLFQVPIFLSSSLFLPSCFLIPLYQIGEFANYITEVRALKFTDKPDYVHLRKIFRDLFIRKGYVYDCVYDWTIRKAAADLVGGIPERSISSQATQEQPSG